MKLRDLLNSMADDCKADIFDGKKGNALITAEFDSKEQTHFDAECDLQIYGNIDDIPYADSEILSFGIDDYAADCYAVSVYMELNVLHNNYPYSGEPTESRFEKEARRILGLPLTKQLVYYKDRRKNVTTNILSYEVVNVYQITETWYIILLHLEDGTDKQIHSAYLRQMQKPNFVETMKEQESKAGTLEDMWAIDRKA